MRALLTLLFWVCASAARNLSAPHNYVRFFMPQLLRDEPVAKIIWLDNDVIVLRDIAALYDSTLRDADRHALAAVVVRRAYDDSMLRRIKAGLEVHSTLALALSRPTNKRLLVVRFVAQGKPFGKADAGGKRPRSLDLTHGHVLKPVHRLVRSVGRRC